MLRLDRVSSGYGNAQVLRDVSFAAKSGEIVCLLGRNGAGKTTTLQSIMGLVSPWSGSVFLGETDLARLPAHQVPRRGVGYVPQGRRLFGELTVAQNLEIGLSTRAKTTKTLEGVLELFPKLRERFKQRTQTLSGGEQQMLAMARALCLDPSVLLLDEPTEGLQPSMIETIRDVIVTMRDRGVAVLLVEQRVEAVLEVADRVVFLENGRVASVVAAAEVARDRALIDRYLGV